MEIKNYDSNNNCQMTRLDQSLQKAVRRHARETDAWVSHHCSQP